MIGIEIDTAQVQRLEKAVTAAGKSMSKEIAGALNQVAKKTRLNMGRRIKEKIKLKKQAIEKPIRVKAEATESKLVAVVSLAKERRLGLENFGAKQTKQGVSYRISSEGKRGMVAGAFMGPRPGMLAPKLHGGVYKRIGENRRLTKGRRQGKIGQPIARLFGVSPWGAYVKNNMDVIEVEAVSKEVYLQMERRINLNVLRASGLVKT